MAEDDSSDPLRKPIQNMINTLKTTVPIGNNTNITNPQHLKIHKVPPGKAKGALLFKNTTNPSNDKVYTQLHFEPFQLGYIELGKNVEMFKELADYANGTAINESNKNSAADAAAAAAKAASAAGGGPGNSPYLTKIANTLVPNSDVDIIKQNATILYYEWLKSFDFKRLNADDKHKEELKKIIDSNNNNIKFIQINSTTFEIIEGVDVNVENPCILVSGISTLEHHLTGKAKFDFKSPLRDAAGNIECDSKEFKEREAERKIASHAIAMVADKGRNLLNEGKLDITYTGLNGQSIGLTEPKYPPFTVGGQSNHFNNLSPNPHNMSKMIEAPLNAFRERGRGPDQVFRSAADENKSRRRKNKKARTMKVFGAAKRNRKIFFK